MSNPPISKKPPAAPGGAAARRAATELDRPSAQQWRALIEVMRTALGQSAAIQASESHRELIELILELMDDACTENGAARAIPNLTGILHSHGGRNERERHEAVRAHHARLLAAGADSPTDETAAHFELSTRQVRRIVNKKP